MIRNRLYIMWSIWRPIFHKVGVSNRVDLRERQVGAKSLFAVRLPYAYAIEAAIHRYMKPINVRFSGDGGSEFFWTINPICALIAYNAHLWCSIAPGATWHYFIGLFLLPIPLDTMLILCIIAIAIYFGFALIAIGVAYMLCMAL